MGRNAFESLVNGADDARDGALRLFDGGFEGAGALLGEVVDVGHQNDDVYGESPQKP